MLNSDFISILTCVIYYNCEEGGGHPSIHFLIFFLGGWTLAVLHFDAPLPFGHVLRLKCPTAKQGLHQMLEYPDRKWLLEHIVTRPMNVYAQWQGHNSREDPPRLETEQYWKSMWERKHTTATLNGWSQWLDSQV